MAQAIIHRATIEAPVLDLLMRERQKALSPREWKFRLMGYGYAIKEVGGRQMVTKLPQNTMLGVLPTDLH
ncbi:hypothetical protein [Pseudodonghicola flavimaris]|uniref:DUF4224 domain-containing protein n=1 Tax=Pseudodonghicola flavimaris TaxID=3050036 RepID=A0ABT7EZA4_9RHOB|nr:hypothetical protein [Pseudodonghicola flavimaris]MDK3017683.1 hypothetical protein [Pseudodonghicola flavimaris]